MVGSFENHCVILSGYLFCRFPLLENGMVILSNWNLFGVSGSGKLDDVTIPEKPK